MKEIKKFIKTNRLISILGGFSSLISILYVASIDSPEWFSGADKWFNLLFQIAVGFIVSFIFYIIQVYIPQQQQTATVNKCIYSRLYKIICRMELIIKELADLYLKGEYKIESISNTQFNIISENFSYCDRVKVLDASRSSANAPFTGESYLTVRDFLIITVNEIEHEIDQLYKYYAPFIGPSLMNITDQIVNSILHKFIVKPIAYKNEDIKFADSTDQVFSPYYNFLKKLKSLSTEYKV